MGHFEASLGFLTRGPNPRTDIDIDYFYFRMHVRKGAEDIMMIAWLFFARLTEQFLHWGTIMPQTRSDQNTQNHVTKIDDAIKAVSSVASPTGSDSSPTATNS